MLTLVPTKTLSEIPKERRLQTIRDDISIMTYNRHMITITFFTSLRASEFVENTKIQLFENGQKSITELVPVKELISNAMYHQKGHRSIMLSLDHEIQSDLKMIIHLDGENVEIDDIPSISNYLQSISN